MTLQDQECWDSFGIKEMYACTEERCSRSFKRPEHLSRHRLNRKSFEDLLRGIPKWYCALPNEQINGQISPAKSTNVSFVVKTSSV
jgi:hypothetical protein